jgi:hypothetical protein
MISYTNKFIFIHINKTAGTSIEHTLKPYGHKTVRNPHMGGFKHSQHFTMGEYKKYLSDEYDKYYKFTVVRNPWDRVVSYYFKGAIQNNLSFTEWVIDKYKNKNFQDYQRMYDPCINWIDVNELDYIIRFETLENDFNDMCSKLGLDCSLQKHNVNNKRGNYRDYYNEETKKLIEEYFNSDIKLFNYKF